MTGIDSIIEMIYSKADKKAADLLEEAEQNKTIILRESQKKANEVRAEFLRKAEHEKEAKLTRHEASAKLQAKYRILEAKEKAIADILDSVNEEIKAKIKSKAYEDILQSFAVSGAVTLNEETLELVLPKGHEKKIDTAAITKAVSKETGKKVKIIIAKKPIRSIGGLIIKTQDGSRMIDNTFEARLEQMSTMIRDKIATKLFVDEE